MFCACCSVLADVTDVTAAADDDVPVIRAADRHLIHVSADILQTRGNKTSHCVFDVNIQVQTTEVCLLLSEPVLLTDY